MQSAGIDYLSSAPSPPPQAYQTSHSGCRGTKWIFPLWSIGPVTSVLILTNFSHSTPQHRVLYKCDLLNGKAITKVFPRLTWNSFSFSHENPSIGTQFRGFCHRQRWIYPQPKPIYFQNLADIRQYSQRYQKKKSPVKAPGLVWGPASLCHSNDATFTLHIAQNNLVTHI